ELDASVGEVGGLGERLLRQAYRVGVTEGAVDVEGDAVGVGAEQPPRDEYLAAAFVDGDDAAAEFLHVARRQGLRRLLLSSSAGAAGGSGRAAATNSRDAASRGVANRDMGSPGFGLPS